MDWVSLGFEIALVLARAVVAAVRAGDASILDRPVREVLGGKLASELVKEAADVRARAKFGSET